VRALTDLAVNAREMLNAIERAEDAIAAMALALKLDQAYADAKARAGALDFDDLIEHAQALLQRSEAAPWVLYKLDGGLDHILIDEGQDTSPTQWNLVTPLQDEFLAGAGARERRARFLPSAIQSRAFTRSKAPIRERFLNESQRWLRAHAAGDGVHRAGIAHLVPHVAEVLACGRRDVASISRSSPARSDRTRSSTWPRAANSPASSRSGRWTPRPVVAEAQPWDAPIDIETGALCTRKLAKAYRRNASRR
jgi:ATP-dependent helicase/nuclease subunit A